MIYHICQYFVDWFVLETENEKSYTFSFINNGIIEFIAFVIHFMFSMMHYSNYIVKNAQLYIYHNNLHSLFDETNIYIWKKNICIFSKSFCYYCSMNIQNYKKDVQFDFLIPNASVIENMLVKLSISLFNNDRSFFIDYLISYHLIGSLKKLHCYSFIF